MSFKFFAPHQDKTMRHFLDIADWTEDEIMGLLERARELKQEWQNGGNAPVLAGKTLGMIFQKPSLRTRVSFDVGMQHLGGHAIMLSPDEIQLGKRESIPDVARVLSGYVEAIMARVFDHAHVLELAKWSSVPVINGLSDESHPCQALADMLTIYERFGKIEGLKVAYVGDGNNVAASLMRASVLLGADFAIATPPQFGLPRGVWEQAIETATSRSVSIKGFSSAVEAVKDAHVIYTDTWVSMGQEDQRAEKIRHFLPYQVNDAMVQHAHDDAIVLHCLPAHRGEEITDDVADGDHSAVFQQAHNRLHAQKALLVELMA
jgi:ornithine carbamoyltransferase